MIPYNVYPVDASLVKLHEKNTKKAMPLIDLDQVETKASGTGRVGDG
jgi:hypothetical protein